MGGNLTFNDNDDVQLKGATDGTLIGNSSDSLKTQVTNAAGASAVNIQDGGNSITVDGSVSATVSGTVAATQSGTWNINNISGTISLPTGASTSALQTTGNSSLSSIDTKTPALGQALAAGSVPVVLTAAQITTLTPLSTVAVTQSTSPWIVTGSGTAGSAATGVLTVQGIASMVALKVDGSAVTQPVSAASLPLPTGASTSALQTTGNTSLSNIDTTTAKLTLTQGSTTSGQSGTLIQGAVTTAAPTYVTAQTSPLSLTTAGALRVDGSSSTQPVSGTVTANQGGTWNINNISGTVSLPTGAATSALQTTGNTSLSSIDTKLTTTNSSLASIDAGIPTALGQTTMSASMPVVISSDQTALPVSQSGTWNLNNISGTISLPTGAATSANQSTEITSLQLIDNPIGPVGAGTAGTNSFLIGGVFNTSLPTLTTGQQSALQFDSSGRLIVSPLTNTSVVKAQLQDNAGNAISSINNQILDADFLNGAGQYRAQNATTSAAEALGAGTILANRKFISITPTAGTVYWGFSNAVTVSSGTPIFKNQTATFAFGPSVHIYIVAASTIDCRIAEAS